MGRVYVLSNFVVVELDNAVKLSSMSNSYLV